MNYNHITKLYKYKKIDKYLINILETQMIYAPTIDQLNDPFESKIIVRNGRLSRIEQEEINNFIKKVNNNETQSIKTNFEFLSNIFYKNNLAFPNEIEIQKLRSHNSFISKIINMFGVLSFTVDNHSLLMWSHYGDSHKGLCLGFDRNNENILGSSNLCFPVNYSTFRKEIDYSEDNNFIIDAFRIKADIWSYEKEWRLITETGKVAINYPGKLTDIYFGLQTNEKDIHRIKDIMGINVLYHKAIIVDNLYKIDYIDL